MELYDVLDRGCHTTLTKAQITKLFQAGRLNRNHPCKLAEKRDWRTIDELFPLLKYDSNILPLDASGGTRSHEPKLYAFVGLLIFLVLSGAFLIWSNHRVLTTGEQNTESLQRDTVSPAVTRVAPPPSSQLQLQTSAHYDSSSDTARRGEQQRREQIAREQVVAANQLRINLERQRQEDQKALGKDYQVPLDENYYVPMKGGGPWVKIHDNDVTSFDVSINGGRRRAVPKEKGISHSRTDETLIYSNGHASLYYVWEISGRLNHCLLRVRDN